MLIDARQIENNSSIMGDVCIIGAGAAGISIALKFIGTSTRIILLEGGGLDYDERMQMLYRGKTTGQNYYPLSSTRLHQFGGTTGHWGGMCSPFEAMSFQRRDWINHSGWPIDSRDLSMFYRDAQQILGLGEDGFDFESWSSNNKESPPMNISGAFFKHKLWKTSPPSHVNFSDKYFEVIRNARNLLLYTYANVTNIESNKDASTVTGVRVRNHAGKIHGVTAKYYVLATCAIQNARLLLASNEKSSRGLGNENDHVGRYFMENAEIHSAELWLNEPSAFSAYKWNSQVPPVRAELALTDDAQRENKIANGMISFQPLDVDKKIPPFIEIWSGEDEKSYKEKYGRIYRWAQESRLQKFLNRNKHTSFRAVLRLEQVPNPMSRISLDAERDELGVPRASLHWAFTMLEKESIRKIYTLLAREVGASGLGRVRLSEEIRDETDTNMPSSTSGGWHHMGTTRMATDPKRGVVNSDCRVHGIDNLYVAGSSCFPNGGAVNPTFTIVALSVRLAGHLKERIRVDG